MKISGLLFIIGLLTIGGLYTRERSLSNAIQPQVAGIATEAPEYTPNVNLSPTPAITVTQNTTAQLPIPTVDPDPIINCTSQHLGVLKLRASVCKVAVECFLEAGKYILASSEDDCKQKQKNYVDGYLGGVTPPPIQNYTYQAPNYYIPPMPTTNPNIAKNAQDQFNQINNNMQNLTPTNTQYITGTPIPCSSLQGQANISQVNCQ